MKCKTFTGTPEKAADLFNQWAKGKVLTREIIIHTQITERIEGCDTTSPRLMIIVFHPEGWDATETIHTAVEMVNQHIIGHQSAQEVT
jgi:hypothetical protein